MSTNDVLPSNTAPSQPKILFTEEGHKVIGPMLGMHACERGFLDQIEGIPITDEQGLKLLLAKDNQTIDDAEMILDAIIRMTLRGNLNAIHVHQDLIYSTWTKLKRIREKTGREVKVLR